MKARTIKVTDEQWEQFRMAAARETAETGKLVTLSEWLRQAGEQRLQREGGRRVREHFEGLAEP